MLVEAAAGTGKTTAMIGRMVALLASGKCRTDTLAAVTFTRKSTAELRARFQIDLEKAARAAKGEDRARLDAAVATVERCVIGTIHSFCARLLRERPVEAGVDVGFQELDELSPMHVSGSRRGKTISPGCLPPTIRSWQNLRGWGSKSAVSDRPFASSVTIPTWTSGQRRKCRCLIWRRHGRSWSSTSGTFGGSWTRCQPNRAMTS